MDRAAAERLIGELYEHALGRKPRPAEFEGWVAHAVNGMPAEEVVALFYRSDEFRARTGVRSTFPPGHFHSPVVDPAQVGAYVARERHTRPDSIAGIELDLSAMRAFWLANLDFIRTTPFTDEPSPANRYDYTGGPYPWGDGIILRAMIGHFRPQRVVEIGSGYSTACMLDSAEHARLTSFAVTCIEPYPERLNALLRADDASRVTLMRQPVQEVDASIVDGLDANDILFIDSTHVMKTGSDVHYELFHLLPRVKAGVLVHVHDVGYPFEYPDPWIFEENYSWNEAYVLRAFLMFNQAFRVFFWNSLHAGFYAKQIAEEYPAVLRNPGTGIWLRRLDPPPMP